jgi:uracil-DNA glycosylase
MAKGEARRNGSLRRVVGTMSDKTPDSIKQVDAEVRECIRCMLHIGRKNAVPGEGNTKARIVFVGEAPGREEDLEGRPFVGMAGKLLSQLLSSVGLRREDVYITNIVKCRPPENRLPLAPEITACSISAPLKSAAFSANDLQSKVLGFKPRFRRWMLKRDALIS